MITEFGKTEDNPGQNDEGKTFGQTPGDDTAGATDNKGMSPEQLEALRIRDAAAQAHIPDLESENSELRDKVVELEDKLASATTIDEALDRISNNSEPGTVMDQAAVNQIVDQALTQRQTEATQDSNWNTVFNALTETYGDWKTADAKVHERAAELDITIDESTRLARNNPKAFLQLFNVSTSTSSPSSGGIRSGGAGQTVVSGTITGDTRDAAFYNKMRKENPKAYWSVDTQAQLRRDLYSN